MSLAGPPFDALMLPGEKITWSCTSQPRPVPWGWALGRVAVGVALLALYGPRFLAVIRACLDAGNMFPARFLGFFDLFGPVAGTAASVGFLWWAAQAVLIRGLWTYGISGTRVFVAPVGGRRAWASAGFIDAKGTVTVTERPGGFDLNVPIHHMGEDDAFAPLTNLAPDDYRAAMAALNPILAKQAP